ncbi:MAG TPA: ATP-dependent Clp protease proteolytic subunit [Azospirillum sp.]|nr:ATP-dependent Clp protease proteolytic subunit [Azospirillum sp.]
MRILLTVLILITALPCLAEGTEGMVMAADAGMVGTMTRRIEGDRTTLRVSGVITAAVAADFIQALDGAPADRPVLVELDSPGGFVKAGYAMIDAMLRQRAAGRPVVTLVRGSAACESMCFGVFMAGFPRRAEAGASFMVHAPRDERSGIISLRTINEMKTRLARLGTSPAWLQTVAERGGFSGRADVRERAEDLAHSGANVVTELLVAR